MIAVIGGGASGLLYTALSREKIALFESEDQIGKKLLISGGSRCNITNEKVSSENYLGDSNFFYEVYNSFSNRDFLEFLHSRKLFPKIEKDGQYFCKSAKRVVEFFQREVRKADLYLSEKVSDIELLEDGEFLVKSSKRTLKVKKVVIATGGLAYPQIGATDFGLKIAEKFGHTINRTSPALVGFTVQRDQFWFKELSGVSLPVNIAIGENVVKGDILFTHRGVSGPAILNSSLYWQKGEISIDFVPHLTFQKILKERREKTPLTAFDLPKRFIKAFLNSIELPTKKLKEYKVDELEKLKTVKNYFFAPAGNFGYKKAEVSRGGIAVDEVDSKNMESKLVPNLLFIGEILDITGEVGGYNLQWAWSSAFKANK